MPKSKSGVSALAVELNQSADANLKHRMLQILDSLEVDERTALESVLNRMREKNSVVGSRSIHQYSYQWLADLLTKHGHPISRNQVRHFMVNIYRKDVQS